MRRGLLLLCATLCLCIGVAPWSVAAKSSRTKKRRAHAISASYIRMRNRWHAPAPKNAVRAFLNESPWPALVLAPVGDAPRQRLLPTTDHGGFDATALELAATALAEKRTGVSHAIEPRLLDVVYDAVRYFNAPFVHVVSGYRQERGGSRHGQGRAVDIVLPGVSDKQLASYFRRQGFLGVGIYHRAGFVHVDVRARSHFWSDNTAPGERSRPRPMLEQAALRYDALARKRGITPTVDAPDAPEMETPPDEGLIDDSSTTIDAGVR